MSENQINACPILVLSWVSVGLQVAMTTCSNPKLQVAHELEYRVVRSAGAADGEIELRAPEEKLVELSSRTPRLRSLTVVTQLTCHGNSDIARVQSCFFFRGDTWLGSCQLQVTMLKPWRGRPHVKIVEAQLSLCTDVESQCCTSTDLDLSCLVVTAP